MPTLSNNIQTLFNTDTIMVALALTFINILSDLVGITIRNTLQYEKSAPNFPTKNLGQIVLHDTYAKWYSWLLMSWRTMWLLQTLQKSIHDMSHGHQFTIPSFYSPLFAAMFGFEHFWYLQNFLRQRTLSHSSTSYWIRHSGHYQCESSSIDIFYWTITALNGRVKSSFPQHLVHFSE